MSDSPLAKFALSPSVSIIIAGVIIAGSIVFVNRYPAPAAAADAQAPAGVGGSVSVPPPQDSEHITGSAEAPIVLIEYSDFQCPYCQMIYPTLKQIVGESNGGVAWVMRDYPLYQIHPEALPAANAAECIADQLGNSAWWKFAEDDFDSQATIGSAFYTAEAQKLGADMSAYNACVSASKFQTQIDQQSADAEASGGQGTPYTVVYNTKTKKQYAVPGALPYAQIMAVINKAKNSQ